MFNLFSTGLTQAVNGMLLLHGFSQHVTSTVKLPQIDPRVYWGAHERFVLQPANGRETLL